MPFGRTEVVLGPNDILLHEDPAPPSLKGHSPQFSSNVGCGQTAGWTEMALGMEVGLGPGDCVRYGGAPNFRPMSIVAKRLHGSRCHLVRR